MKTMYLANRLGWQIETLLVVLETEKMVEVKTREGHGTRRMKKEGQVFPTFTDAKAYLAESAKKEKEEARRRLANAENRHAEMLALTENDVKSA